MEGLGGTPEQQAMLARIMDYQQRGEKLTPEMENFMQQLFASQPGGLVPIPMGMPEGGQTPGAPVPFVPGGSEEGMQRVYLGGTSMPAVVPEGAMVGGVEGDIQDEMEDYSGKLFSCKYPKGWKIVAPEKEEAAANATDISTSADTEIADEKVQFLAPDEEVPAVQRKFMVSVRRLVEPVVASEVSGLVKNGLAAQHEGFSVSQENKEKVGEAQDTAHFRSCMMVNGKLAGVQYFVGVLNKTWLIQIRETVPDTGLISGGLQFLQGKYQMMLVHCAASLTMNVSEKSSEKEEEKEKTEQVEIASTHESALSEEEEEEESEDVSPNPTSKETITESEKVEEIEEADDNVVHMGAVHPADAMDAVAGARVLMEASSADDENASESSVDQVEGNEEEENEAVEDYFCVQPYKVKVNPEDPNTIVVLIPAPTGITSFKQLKRVGDFQFDGRKIRIAAPVKEDSNEMVSLFEGTLFGSSDPDSFTVEYIAKSKMFSLTLDEVKPASGEWPLDRFIIGPRVEGDFDQIDAISLDLLGLHATHIDQACKYAEMAAKKGSAAACRRLADKLKNEEDYKGSVQYLLKAVQANDAAAKSKVSYELGMAYRLGRGISKDLKKASNYLRTSAQSGYTKALYEVAHMYLKGEGFAQNTNAAFTMFRAAVSRASAPACEFLGRCYLGLEDLPSDTILKGGRNNPVQAVEYFSRARAIDPTIVPPPELEQVLLDLKNAKEQEKKELEELRAKKAAAAARAASLPPPPAAAGGIANSVYTTDDGPSTATGAGSSKGGRVIAHAPAAFANSLKEDIDEGSRTWTYAGYTAIGLCVFAFGLHHYFQRNK